MLKLYRRHFGVLPLATQAPQPLDAMAAWSQDHQSLTLAVVNPSLNPVEVELNVQAAKLAGGGNAWQIAGNDPMAFNDPANPAVVSIAEAALPSATEKLLLAPCSVTLFALPAVQ